MVWIVRLFVSILFTIGSCLLGSVILGLASTGHSLTGFTLFSFMVGLVYIAFNALEKSNGNTEQG